MKPSSPKITSKSFFVCLLQAVHSSHNKGCFLAPSYGEKSLENLPFLRTLVLPQCFAELGMPFSTAPVFLLIFTKGDWIPGPLEHPAQEYLLLAWPFRFIFVSYIQSIWAVCTEHCKVIVSSHPYKLEFYFAKTGKEMLILTCLKEPKPHFWSSLPTEPVYKGKMSLNTLFSLVSTELSPSALWA